jgi:hypothetical protein
MCHSLATLDKLVDTFPLPPPIGDTSPTHVRRHIQLRHNANCDGTIIYNNPVFVAVHRQLFSTVVRNSKSMQKLTNLRDTNFCIASSRFICDRLECR